MNKRAATLTASMRRLLDQSIGKDLILTASRFRQFYGLNEKEAGALILQWMNEPA